MELPVKYDDCTSKEKKLIREEYIKLQENRCWLCQEPLDQPPGEKTKGIPIDKALFPPLFFKWPIHLHHCHKTGLTIGAVHAKCNAILWQYYGE